MEPDRVAVWGTALCRSPAHAAALNAARLPSRSQNDTHAAISGHLGCVVWPAVLALAEHCESDAADVMAAALAGFEVAVRMAGDLAADTTARG